MIRACHERQPAVVTDQPFVVTLQFNYSSLRIKICLADEFAWITSTAFSLLPVLKAGGSVSPFVHIARPDDVVNMNLCFVIEIRIFRIHKGPEYLFTDAWILFIDHFLRHGFRNDL